MSWKFVSTAALLAGMGLALPGVAQAQDSLDEVVVTGQRQAYRGRGSHWRTFPSRSPSLMGKCWNRPE
jgi:hypothetical protein